MSHLRPLLHGTLLFPQGCGFPLGLSSPGAAPERSRAAGALCRATLQRLDRPRRTDSPDRGCVFTGRFLRNAEGFSNSRCVGRNRAPVASMRSGSMRGGKIAILVPTYNGGSLLRETVMSAAKAGLTPDS